VREAGHVDEEHAEQCDAAQDVHALDALADAASALGDRLDRSTLEARSVELFVTSGLAAIAASGQAAPGDPSGPGPR
jgi:hypothetical protein